MISEQEPQFVLKSIENFIESALGLNIEDLEYSINVRERANNFDLFFSEKGDEFYLKFGDLDGTSKVKKIEITRIMFNKVRSGHGTALLLTLSKIADKYNYSEITIDSPNENSKAFGEKLGFRISDGILKVRVKDLKIN